jgi:hypothetical protein
MNFMILIPINLYVGQSIAVLPMPKADESRLISDLGQGGFRRGATGKTA